MKRLFIAALACLGALGMSAQQNQQYYEVNTSPNHRHHGQDFRPNEVIVKFKTEGPVAMKAKANGAYSTTNVKTVDDVLSQYNISTADQLMPLTGRVARPHKVKSYSGKDVEVKDLSKLYCLKAKGNIDVDALVKELSALPEVEFAEPNYIVHVNSAPNDPLYSEQWGIPAVKADQLWEKSTIVTKRPVIAILDTGVDIAHPDLADNIWTNAAEAAGSEGYDDDGNGFKDDLHGWDFVNQTGQLDDYNGHGTHCAGIAAAVGNNGIGICGANPDAYIMAITVMQSDGSGDVATIIKGIDYAAANSADVISMSFGSYSHSIAEEQALARAYSKSVLVAAAGNDCMIINPDAKCPICKEWGKPMFPAAFTFVLGVEAYNASFSNRDDDGPIYSAFSEEQLYNYELTAPGTNIMSTYPDGQYRALNGTSMACPLVAGAVSRLLQTKEYPTKELLFGDLIHTAGSNVDFFAAYNITDADRKPNTTLVSYRIDDSEGGDGDGRFDAGETIYFYPMVRNDWGTANNVRVWIDEAEFERDVIEVLEGYESVSFEKPLSSYAKAESANPIRFKLADNVTDGRHCRLVFYAQCDGMDEPMAQEIVITAENGVEIGGMIEHDLVLEPGVSYIVTNSLAIPDGVKLTIKPGAVLKFSNNTGISQATNAIVEIQGTAENPIIFTSRDLTSFPSVVFSKLSLSYVHFSNLLIWGTLKDCTVENCVFKENKVYAILTSANILNSNFYDNASTQHCYLLFTPNYFYFNNFINNLAGEDGLGHLIDDKFRGDNLINNTDYFGKLINYSTRNNHSDEVGITHFNKAPYFGSSIESTVRLGIEDIESGFGVHKVDLSNMLTQPSPLAHGIVWKVCVNGYDAQDEFNMLPPLGVGTHKFEVWYSKKIDETEEPLLAMGVRPPYTQTSIGENGSWRTETIQNCFLLENVKVVNGTCEDAKGWVVQISNGGLYVTDYYRVDGFDGKQFVFDSWNEPMRGRMHQSFDNIPNGNYKFKISVKADQLAEGDAFQYIYANGNKTFIDSTDPKVYEVETIVTDHKLEIGFNFSVKAKINGPNRIGFDNASVELIEEAPGGRDLDVSVYTAYLTIKGGMAIDGLNRIYVNGCRDLEHFDIPREDSRFNVEVAAAGSMSTGFMAEPGLGKVTLTWEEQDENVEDILGYNMYRYTGHDETTAIKINERTLNGTQYVDYEVLPGTTYSYFYKIMRTSMTENSPSKTVSVTPLTASKGDANGSMTVDVADVVTEVNHMLGQNPQPFIFEAADVNGDGEVNILDVVGTINIILQPSTTGIQSIGSARYWVEDGVLYIDSDVALAGLQFRFNGVDSKNVVVLEDLKEFETVVTPVDDDCMFLAYSMVGKTLSTGKHALLRIGDGAQTVQVALSDPTGTNVVAIEAAESSIQSIEAAQMRIPTPNPFDDAVSIPYVIGKAGNHDVEIIFTDITGRTVGRYATTAAYGEHSYTWKAIGLGSGIYFATLSVDGKFVQSSRLVKR